MTSTSNADLFADELVASYVDDPAFTPRPWLGELVHAAVADNDCRLVLLEAEPGAGKTALMASLARTHANWLRFFLRRDSRLPWQSGDVRSFLFTVGHQLAARQPQLFRSRQLEVTVKQIVDRVRGGGRVVGISVSDLTVSPFYRTALRVEQHVSLLEGDLTGLSVDRLTVEERLLDVANLQYLALLAPAEALATIRPHEPLVVLVDALDEIIRSPAADGSNVLTWLATVPELSANLRFVVASRPDREILELLRTRYRDQLRRLHIDPHSTQVRDDLTRYARGLVRRQPVAAALDRRRITPKEFVGHAVQKADGNFQYLAALLAALHHAAGRGDEDSISTYLRLDALPTSLGELYAFLLNQIRWGVRDLTVDRPGTDMYAPPVRQAAWPALYQPILGLLTVAGRPLTEHQIGRFGNLPAGDRWVLQAVEALAPLLRRGPAGLSLYHASLAEFLSAEGTRSRYPQLYVDPAEWRLSILRSYRGDAHRWDDVAWANVDDYGLLTLARHLRALAGDDADSPYAAELDGLLCAQLMREKHGRFGSHRPFAEDVRLSVGLAVTDRSTTGPVLVRDVRGRYLLALFDALASAIPVELITVLARMGEVGRAVALADVRADRLSRARVYLSVGTALVDIGAQDGQILIEQALDMLKVSLPGRSASGKSRGDRLAVRAAAAAASAAGESVSSELTAAAAALRRRSGRQKSEAPATPISERVRQFISRLPPSTAEVRDAHDLAGQATATLDDLVAAAHRAVRALVAVDRDSSTRLDELSALAGLLAEAGARDQLTAALDLALRLPDDIYGTRAGTWAAFATACAQLGDRRGLARLLTATTRVPDNTYRATVLASLARAVGMVGDESGIEAVLEASWKLDPAFVSPARVLAEVPAGALDGGRRELARRYTLDLVEQFQAAPDDPETRVRLLHDIAAALVDVDRKDAARAICHEAVPIAARFVEMTGASQGLDFTGMGDRAIALADLAEELGRCGDADGAWSVGQQALAAAATTVGQCEMCHAVGLRLARGMVAAGDVDRVRGAIAAAGQACGFEPTARVITAQIGLVIAPLLHASGEGQAASEHLQWAARVAGGLDGDRADDLYGELVIAFADTDRPERASQTIDAIGDPFVRASCLRYLAERRADDGKPEEAVPLARTSLDRLDAMDRLIDRIDTQAGAAHVMARCGDHQAARHLADTALQSLETLDAQWHARPLGRIAACAILADDPALADRAFALATHDLRDSSDPRPVVEVATHVMRTSGPGAVERITELVATSADPLLTQEINGLVVRAHLDAADVTSALRTWRTLLDDDRLAALPDLVGTLNRGCRAIAALDRGHTLIALYRVLVDARGWWESASFGPDRTS